MRIEPMQQTERPLTIRELNRLEVNISRGILVSDEDRDLLTACKWSISRGYAHGTSTKFNKQGLMHRVVMERLVGRKLGRQETVDHINRIGIDNRRENLRIATLSQNLGNQGVNKNSKSGIKGVAYIERLNKWTATIHYQRKRYYLGVHPTAIEAKASYDAAAIRLYGEFARFD